MSNIASTNTKSHTDLIVRCLLVSLMSAVICTGTAETVYAAQVGVAMCSTVNAVMSSGLGRAIATVGVLTVGVGAAMGRVSVTMIITVAIGISAMCVAGRIAMDLGAPASCYG